MTQPGNRRGAWVRIWSFARPYRIRLALTFLLALLATPLALLAPLPLQIAVDSIIGNRPLPSLLAIAVKTTGGTALPAELILVAGLLIATTLLMYVQGLLSC